MASNNDGYLSRSWALLTRDKGWYKPLLVLSAAQLVPIIGVFGVSGYALEWGRLTAWGVDAAPKQKNVDIWACVKSGARAFVVALCYGLVFGLIRGALSVVMDNAIGWLLSLLLTTMLSVCITVVTLRATIYQSIGAGFEVTRILDMIKRDYEGLFRIVGMSIALAFGISMIASLLVGVIMVANAGEIIREVIRLDGAVNVDEVDVALAVFGWIGSMLPFLLVAAYVLGIFSSAVGLLMHAAVGLWMRQFDVQHWGESHDPLPNTAPGYPSAGRPASNAGQAAATGFGQPTPDQVAASQNYEVPQAYDVPQQAPQSYEPQPESPYVVQDQPSMQPQEVPTFSLDDVTEAPAEPVQPVEPAPVAIPMPVAEVETFTLDDMTPSVAPEPEPEPEPVPETPVATFTLDDVPSGVPEMAPMGTLDEAVAQEAAQFAFEAEAALAAEDEVPAEPAPAEEPAPESDEPHTFTLEDAIEQSRAIVDAGLTEAIEPPAVGPDSIGPDSTEE